MWQLLLTVLSAFLFTNVLCGLAKRWVIQVGVCSFARTFAQWREVAFLSVGLHSTDLRCSFRLHSILRPSSPFLPSTFCAIALQHSCVVSSFSSFQRYGPVDLATSHIGEPSTQPSIPCAVVIGGSVAGLVTTAVLAKHCQVRIRKERKKKTVKTAKVLFTQPS